MATILMTGVTGTVMNPLCARLLEEGHTIVALVRPSKEASPAERLAKTLDVREEARRNLFVLPGDITQELGGVAPQELRLWHGKIEKIMHGAANIKFVETADKQVFNTNVYGTKHMLRLAEALDVSEFHYVSTAYVARDAEESVKHGATNLDYRNVYERSKARAEELVRRSGGSFAIYRIPIVVGDSRTGEIRRFSGYYGFFAPFWQLFQTLQNKNGGGLPEGIQRDGENSFCVPLWLPCTTVGPLNLIPLDWLTDMLLALLKIPAQGQTFHLTHPHPRTVKETIEVSTKYLGLQGITCGLAPTESTSKILQRLQRSIAANIKPFKPYTSKDEEWFDNKAAVQVLGENWREPPDIDSLVMGRLLEFAKRKNFGRSSGA